MRNQNSESRLNLLISANDDESLDLFADIEHLIDGRPIVPEKVYGKNRVTGRNIRYFDEFRSFNFADGESPILMRGARWVMVDKYRNKSAYWKKVGERYVRAMKLNITDIETRIQIEEKINNWAWGKGMSSRTSINLISCFVIFSSNPYRITLSGKQFYCSDWPKERFDALQKLQKVFNRFTNSI